MAANYNEIFMRTLPIIQRELNLSNNQMANILGVNSRTFMDYKSGTILMPADKLITLIKELKVNPIFLYEIDKDAKVILENENTERDDLERLYNISFRIINANSDIELCQIKEVIEILLKVLMYFNEIT